MKLATLYVDPPYLQDRIFDPGKSIINRDDCLCFYRYLKDFFKFKGYFLSTQDIHPVDQSEFVIYNSNYYTESNIINTHKSFMIMWESELIAPQIWNLKNHYKYNKIFTWCDTLVDQKKYFKYNYYYYSKNGFSGKFSEHKKLAVMISGNKTNSHRHELYSERLKVINWFERHQPADFDLFGPDWNKSVFHGVWRPLNRIKPLRNVQIFNHPCYRGEAEDKLATLANYKFSICFENAKDIPGYITEKIWDSLSVGCIPVYCGAPNIFDCIPEGCIIDYRKYASLPQLYQYLKAMHPAELRSRFDLIESAFMQSIAGNFSARNVAENIGREILRTNLNERGELT